MQKKIAMKRNYSELIKCKRKRLLTAKGFKFLNRSIEIVAQQNGTSRYDPRMKPLKEKLTNIYFHLIIDKEMTVEQIKELIKNRKILLPQSETA